MKHIHADLLSTGPNEARLQDSDCGRFLTTNLIDSHSFKEKRRHNDLQTPHPAIEDDFEFMGGDPENGTVPVVLQSG